MDTRRLRAWAKQVENLSCTKGRVSLDEHGVVITLKAEVKRQGKVHDIRYCVPYEDIEASCGYRDIVAQRIDDTHKRLIFMLRKGEKP